MKTRAWFRSMSCSALLPWVLGGCASTSHLPPIDKQSTVAFVVVWSPRAQGATPVEDHTVRHKAVSGAGIGAATGTLAALACGPLFALCLPISAVGGMAYGADAGLVTGLFTALPRDQAAQIGERLNHLEQSHDPVVAMQANLLERAREHWQLSDVPPTNAVATDGQPIDAIAPGVVTTLEIQRLDLQATNKKEISLVMQVLVHTAMADARQARQQRFEYVSTKSSTAAWLDESSDVPETVLLDAYQHIAEQVITELTRS